MAEYENGRDCAARLAKEQKADDDRQWRRYAEAALSGLLAKGNDISYSDAAVGACSYADALLSEQKRRGR